MFVSFVKANLLLFASLVAQLGLAQPASQTASQIPAPKMSKLQDQAITSEQGAWIYMPLGDDPAVIQVPGEGRQWLNCSSEGKSAGFRSARNGFIWDIRSLSTVVEGKLERHNYLYRHPEGPTGPWERVAEFDSSAGVPHYFVPLDRSGWFLGVSPFMGFFKEGRASHVALFRQQSERLLFEDLVDMPFGDRSHIGELEEVPWPRPAGSKAPDPKEKPRMFRDTIVRPATLTPDLWVPALLPNYLVLGASKAGVLWFFSLKNGQFQRMVDLGGVPSDELDKLGHLDHFLLSAQPNKDHRLLVVTRQPETLFFARALYTPRGVPKNVWVGNHKRFMEIMEEHPGLQWWAINPETGTKERIEDPTLPEQAASFTRAGQLRFLVGPDGRVHATTRGSWQDLYDKMGLNSPVSPVQKESPKEPVTPKGEEKEGAKANPPLPSRRSSERRLIEKTKPSDSPPPMAASGRK